MNNATVESPVEITPKSEDVPAPPALLAKKLEVLEVKRATVESPEDTVAWRELIGVDQFCKRLE